MLVDLSQEELKGTLSQEPTLSLKGRVDLNSDARLGVLVPLWPTLEKAYPSSYLHHQAAGTSS